MQSHGHPVGLLLHLSVVEAATRVDRAQSRHAIEPVGELGLEAGEVEELLSDA
ncbi:MAG: hypothetical protein ACR2RB_13340 [Gammaproteobacteria bacterium]